LRDQLQEYINEELNCDELSKMKMTLNQFETEVSNLKIELQMMQAANKRLGERVECVEKDNQQVLLVSLLKASRR
jgi:hypothetical protein